FHPRTLLAARDAAMRWAFWLTLLAMFSALAATEAIRTALQLATEFPAAQTLVVLVGLLLCPFYFVLLLILGLVGGALGAFRAPAGEEQVRAARTGVGAWWLSVVLAYLLSTVAHWLAPVSLAVFGVVFCYLGVPVVTLCLASLARRPGADPEQLLRRM